MASVGNPNWRKGMKKVGGRRKGVTNKATFDLRLACQAHGAQIVTRLHEIAFNRIDLSAANGALKILTAYGWGKPHETLAVSGELTLKQDVEQAQTQTKHQLLRLIQGGQRGNGHGNGDARESDPAAPTAATA